MTDWELIQQYRQTKSHDAFAQLVHRHIGWVRAAALRQVRDAHAADDVAQAVFLALAQQAHRLREGTALSTWLFQVTRYASWSALRAASRRKRHERQAAATTMTSRATDNVMTAQQWDQLSLALDQVVARLRRDDQRAVLLRFYERKSYPEIAALLGVSEEAARKRTDRAVDKLRHLLGNRDVAFSADALSATLLAHAAAPAAPSLAAAAIELAAPAHAAAASAGSTAAATTTSTSSIPAIAKGAIHMMNLMRIRLPLATGVGVLLLAAVAVPLLTAAPKRAAATRSAPPPAAPAAAPAAAAAATNPVAAENSPKAVVLAAFRAASNGDAAGLVSRFDRVTPQQADTLAQVTRLMSALRQLVDAVSDTYGADVERQFTRAIGTGVREADLTDAVETIYTDRAVVDIRTGPGEIPLVRSAGTWKISAEVLRTLDPAAVRQFATRAPAMQQLAADVRAGKYETMPEFQRAVQGLMRPARRPPTTAATAPVTDPSLRETPSARAALRPG